ncbi:hypothetical protein BDZ89DRAFT_332447 [Hymenopellis radicata]|nr:hypothetical protein BDZ89DRAFT_332447 [Hymenopellis radicata]
MILMSNSSHIIAEYHLKIAKFISENDFTGHQQGLLQQKIKNTGTWLIQDPAFVAWRDDRESPRTLWCYGHPGAGKSVMAAFIVDHLQSRGDIVLSVFCRYSESNTFTTPYPILYGLLGQLIETSSKMLPTICDLYQSQTRPDPDMLPVFLAEIAASHARPIYIVIDAVDECQIALDLLRAIQRIGPAFRVLVTSRPVFKEIEEHPSIKIRASDNDILIAVDATLLQLKHDWLDEELKQAIREKVVEKAGGMFLLASLQLRELERDVTCRRDVVAILDSLPRNLDDAYKLTFQRIREQGERKHKLACRALALIALHSFEETAVQHLLAEGDSTQYTGIEMILQCCQGLVQSVRGYLRFVFIRIIVCTNIPHRTGRNSFQSISTDSMSVLNWDILP